MLEELNSTKNTGRNNIQATLINNALTDFKNRINTLSENEIRFDQRNETVNIVQKVLEFHRQQRGRGLKILTPNQMLNRLPIYLAQLKLEIIQKNLKMKSDNYCILCRDQKTYKKRL